MGKRLRLTVKSSSPIAEVDRQDLGSGLQCPLPRVACHLESTRCRHGRRHLVAPILAHHDPGANSHNVGDMIAVEVNQSVSDDLAEVRGPKRRRSHMDSLGACARDVVDLRADKTEKDERGRERGDVGGVEITKTAASPFVCNGRAHVQGIGTSHRRLNA